MNTLIEKMILFVILIVLISKLSKTNSMNDIYTNCETKTFRCFGIPSDCITNRNCNVLLSVKPLEKSGADFNLHWNRDSSTNDHWVGAALSRDRNMGDDSVTECILWMNNSLTVRQGLTYCDDDVNDDDCGVETVGPIDGISNEKASYSDGWLSCSWTRSYDTNVKNLDFNIYDNKYHVMLAFGPIRRERLRHHSKAMVTKEAEYLARPQSWQKLKRITDLTNIFNEYKPNSNPHSEEIDIIYLNPYQFIKLLTNSTFIYYRQTIIDKYIIKTNKK